MTKDYIKHLLECKCILPQFKNSTPPIFHKFLVFSELDMVDGNVVSSYVQCNNCGVIHKILEIGRSDVLKRETMPSLITIEDIKASLPSRLVSILEQSECPLPLWQEAQFILQNGLWGRGFTLTQEREGNNIIGKYIVILGETIYDIKSFERSEGMI